MPRPERVLDPSTGAVGQFAGELRALRRRVGSPSYRKMATDGPYSATTLAEAAAGRRLPALPVVLHYVRACGGDLVGWEQRWRETARQLAAERDDGAGAPYLGLAAFGPADADRFFGREGLVDRLVTRLERGGLTVVVGASGSGKSSLLRAGLVPAVEAAGRPAWVFTPGPDPAGELARVEEAASINGAVPAAANGPAPAALLVIDQFEEAFTLCRDGAERAAFFDRLVTVARRNPIVIGVRADFLVRCAAHTALTRAMAGGTVVVGAMEPDGLRRAITEPARRTGLTVERALVAQVLADVDGRPGALPLVSHALLETWRQCQGTGLTLAGYQAAGGVTGAIADTAERVYASLSDQERLVARELLVRLTALGEGVEDTRQRIDLGELDLAGIDVVVERFASARLVVVHAQTVEFAHEAVITAWPRLSGWLAEDRDALRTHRQLTEAAGVWRSLGRDAGALYRGARLAIAREWAARPARRAMLTGVEAEFLDASLAAEAAEHATAARRTRHLRRLTRALASLLVLATAMAGTALWQWRTAVGERQQALSQQRAAQAVNVAQTDVAQAMRLSIAAWDAGPTVEARGALLSLAARRHFSGRLQNSSPLRDVVFSPDGTTLATADMAGRVVLWDVARRTPRATLIENKVAVRAIAFSPDGRLLVGVGAGGSVIVCDVLAGRELRRLRGHRGVVDGVAFAPDGRTFATIGADHRILLWAAADGGRAGELDGSGGRNADVVFTPDGRQLISVGDDARVAIWDLSSRARVRAFNGGQPLYTVAVSPDGALVAAAGEGKEALVWDLRSGRQRAVLRAHTAVVSVVRFVGPNTLITVGYDALAAMWDVRSGRRVTNFPGSTSSLFGAAASRDGRMFAAAGRDRSVLLWERPVMPLLAHTDEVGTLSVAPDGSALVSGDLAGSVLLWPVGSGPRGRVADRTATPSALAGATGGIPDIAFAPESRLVAAAGEDRAVWLWDTTRPQAPGRPLAGHTDQVRSVAFHPGGRLLASGGADRTIRLWDLPAGTVAATLRQPDSVIRVVFSHGGARFVSAALDGTVTVWDTDSRQPVGSVKDEAGIVDVAVSPDGRVAAVARPDGEIKLWDVAARRVVTTLRGHRGPVSTVQFSPDGRLLASGGFDEQVVLWRAPEWRKWAQLVGHGADVLSAAWSPDGRILYTGSSDHTITPWWVDPATARTVLCADLPRAFPDMPAPECDAAAR